MKKACGNASAEKRDGDPCNRKNRGLLNRVLAVGLALLQCFALSGCIIVSGRADLPMAPRVTVPLINTSSDVIGLSTKKYDIGGTEAFYILPGMESHPDNMIDFACFDYTSNGEFFYMYTTPCYIPVSDVYAYKGTEGTLPPDFSGSPQPDRSQGIICDAMAVMRYNPVTRVYHVVDVQAYDRNLVEADTEFYRSDGYYMLAGAYGGKVADTETYFVIDREGAITVYDKDGNVELTGAVGALVRHELANAIVDLYTKKEGDSNPSDDDGDMSDDDKKDRDDLLSEVEDTITDSSGQSGETYDEGTPLEFGVSDFAKKNHISILMRSAVMDGQGISYLSFMIYDKPTPWDADAKVFDRVISCYTAKLDESLPLISYNRSWNKQKEEWLSYDGKTIDCSKSVTVLPALDENADSGEIINDQNNYNDGIIIRSSLPDRSNYKAFVKDEDGRITYREVPLDTPIPFIYPEQLSLLMSMDSIKGGLFDPDSRNVSNSEIFKAQSLAMSLGVNSPVLNAYIGELTVSLNAYSALADYLKSRGRLEELPDLNVYSDDYSAFVSTGESLKGFVGGWIDVTRAKTPNIPDGLYFSYDEWKNVRNRLSYDTSAYLIDLDYFRHPYRSSTELLDYITAFRDSGYEVSDGEYTLYNNLQGGLSQYAGLYANTKGWYGVYGWKKRTLRDIFGRVRGLWSSVSLYDNGSTYWNLAGFRDVLTDVSLRGVSFDIKAPELFTYSSDRMPEFFRRLWNGKSVSAEFKYSKSWYWFFWNRYKMSSFIKGSTNNWKRAHYVGAGSYYENMLGMYLRDKNTDTGSMISELEKYDMVPVMGGWNVFAHTNESPFVGDDRVEMLTFCNEVRIGTTDRLKTKVAGICEIPMDADGQEIKKYPTARTEVAEWNEELNRTYKIKVESRESAVIYYVKNHGKEEGQKGKRFNDILLKAMEDVREQKKKERQDALDEIERRVKEAGDRAVIDEALKIKNTKKLPKSVRNGTEEQLLQYLMGHTAYSMQLKAARRREEEKEREIAEEEIIVPPEFTEKLEKEYWDDKDNWAAFVEAYIRTDEYFNDDDISEILDIAEHLIKIVETVPAGTIPTAYRLKLPEGSSVSYADMADIDGTSNNSMKSGAVLYNSKTVKDSSNNDKTYGSLIYLTPDGTLFSDSGVDGQATDAGSLYYAGQDGSKEMIVLITEKGVKFYSGPEALGGSGAFRTGTYNNNDNRKTWYMTNEELLSSSGYSPQTHNLTNAAVEQRAEGATGNGSSGNDAQSDEGVNEVSMEEIGDYLHSSKVGTLQSASSFTLTGMNEMLISAYDSGLSLFNTGARVTVSLAEGSYYQSFKDANNDGIYKVLGFNTLEYEYFPLDLARAKVYNLDLGNEGRDKAYETAVETQLGQMVSDYIRMPLRTTVNSKGKPQKIFMNAEELEDYSEMSKLFSPSSTSYEQALQKLCSSVGMAGVSDAARELLQEYRNMVLGQQNAMRQVSDLTGMPRKVFFGMPKEAYWLNVQMRLTQVEDRDSLYDIMVEIMLNEDLVRTYPNTADNPMRKRYNTYRKIYDPESKQGSVDAMLKENDNMSVTYENGEPVDRLPSGYGSGSAADEENELKKADESAHEKVQVKIGDYEGTDKEREKALEGGDVYSYLRDKVESPAEPSKSDNVQTEGPEISENLKIAGYRQEIIEDIEKKLDKMLGNIGAENKPTLEEVALKIVEKINPDNFKKSRDAVLKEFLEFLAFFDGKSVKEESVQEKRAERVEEAIPNVNSVLELEGLIISEQVLLGKYLNKKERIGKDENGKYIFNVKDESHNVKEYIDVDYPRLYEIWSENEFDTAKERSEALRQTKMYEDIISEYQGSPVVVEFLTDKDMTWKEYMTYVIRNVGGGAVQDDSGDNENKLHDTEAIGEYYKEHGTLDGISVDLSEEGGGAIKATDESGQETVLDEGIDNEDENVSSTASGTDTEETGNQTEGGNKKDIATDLLTDDSEQ
ncbi:MAG: hypothetical protein K6C95_07220 [Lachnospiraceae bacterium]|nr:hypothetical protein [Lachnospiraceae bacterium]